MNTSGLDFCSVPQPFFQRVVQMRVEPPKRRHGDTMRISTPARVTGQKGWRSKVRPDGIPLPDDDDDKVKTVVFVLEVCPSESHQLERHLHHKDHGEDHVADAQHGRQGNGLPEERTERRRRRARARGEEQGREVKEGKMNKAN